MTIPQIVSERKTVQTSATTMDADAQSTVGSFSDANPLFYAKTEAVALRVAKMLSYTLIAMAAIIGTFMFMSALVQTRRCSCGSSFSSESRDNPYYEPLTALSSEDTAKEMKRLPIRIQMDASAGDLMRNKQKGHMSCAVERKTATQIIASEPKMLITPYGNITTDPRIIQLKGEKMVFTCSTKDKMLPRKNKTYRKFSTILNLNKVDKKPETGEAKVTTKLTDMTDKEPKERPKRSLEKPAKKECACDCSC